MHACMHAWHRQAWSVRDNPTEAAPLQKKAELPVHVKMDITDAGSKFPKRSQIAQPHLRLAQGSLRRRSSLPGMRQENIHNVSNTYIYLTTAPTATTIKKHRARP